MKWLVFCVFTSSFVVVVPRELLEPNLGAGLKSVPDPGLQPENERNIFCYFASWTVYRPGRGSFDVRDIDPFLCTHISFAFVGLNIDSSINTLDPWESSDPTGFNGFNNLVSLKAANPKLKILLSMGGWNEGSQIYSHVAADPMKRKLLALNVLRYIEQWGFDGFDLDWEYPGFRNGNKPIDKDNFTELLKELASLLKPLGYLLTAAVAGAVDIIDAAYDIPALNELLDMINVMVYDFHGADEEQRFVGHNSPLYSSSLDVQNNNGTYNVKSGIDFWLAHGASPEKINMGIVTYGRSFTLLDSTNTSLYAPALGGGIAGPYSRQSGILGYNEICEYYLNSNYIWDDEQKVPHRIWGDQWVGFEDQRSIQFKVDFALDNRLGGIMVWSFDSDDFRGTCGEKYPLINAVRNGLFGPPGQD